MQAAMCKSYYNVQVSSRSVVSKYVWYVGLKFFYLQVLKNSKRAGGYVQKLL